MTHVIAIANQKGGVGKTTTCVNLAASLAHRGRRVLLIDMDPQGNTTAGSGLTPAEQSATMNELLLGEQAWPQVCVNTAGGYDLLPGNGRLTQAEVQLLQHANRTTILREALGEGLPYDHILIDCPPSLNMLTINALMVADGVLIPMQCEYYALEGVAALLQTIDQLQQSGNPHLKIEGVLRTMFDGRNRLTQEISEQLSQYFGPRLLQTIIPRNVRLAEAPSHGLPVLAYDAKSLGAQAYLALADELLARERGGVSNAAVSTAHPQLVEA